MSRVEDNEMTSAEQSPQANAIEPRQQVLWTFMAVALALGGQYLLDQGTPWVLPAALFIGAVALFLRVYHHRAAAPPVDERVGPRNGIPWVLVGGAVVLGALAFPRFTGNRFRPDATLLWVAGLILLGVAAWRGDGGRGPQPRDGRGERAVAADGLRLHWRHLLLLAMMALGAFYRLYRIGEIPLEMGPDLPHIYNNIRYILRSEYLIFFPSHPGREGLFFYLAAAFCRLVGLEHVTIKMASGLIGVATIPAMYLLGRELYGRLVGLLAAFFVSVSHWHIIITRAGFRASTVPLLVALVWYFLVRGLKTQRRWFFALSGFFLGLGMYSYNAWMIAPAMVVGMLLTLPLVGRWRTLRANLDNVALLVIASLLVFVPLGRYAYEEPNMYLYRAATRVTDMETTLPSDLIGTFMSNLVRTLLMFNHRGDSIFISNVPFMRQLGFVSAALLVIGAAYLLWRWRSGYNLTVWVVLLVMIMPSVMALAFPNEVPNAIRAFGALPAAMLLPAVVLDLAMRRLAALLPVDAAHELRLTLALDGGAEQTWRWQWRQSARLGLVGILVVLLGYEAWLAYPTYFKDYLSNLPNSNYSITLEMARVIDDFAEEGEAYIRIWPHWYDGNAVRAQLRRVDQSWHNELLQLAPDHEPLSGPPGRFVVILHPDDQETLQMLRQRFARGIDLVRRDNDRDIAFITFYGER